MSESSTTAASAAGSAEAESRAASPMRACESLLLLIFLACAIAAVSQAAPLQSANDRSRWCTVWSLVERGTYQIDEIDRNPQWSTIDKVRHRESEQADWHFYSSKPPLLSTMVAGLYWLEIRTVGWHLIPDTALVTRLLLCIVNVLPYFLALIVLRRFLHTLRCTGLTRLTVLATAAFGSMLLPFLTTLNNHTPAAVCAMLTIPALMRLAGQGETQNAKATDFALLGFFAALTSCFELPAALLGVIAFVVAVRRDVSKTLLWFVPAALIPLAVFFVTNWICTGGIKPFYAYYGTEKYEYIHEGIPSYWMTPRGIDANDEPAWLYFLHCTIGHHGVFSLSPILLLTVAGWWVGIRSREKSPATAPLRFVLWAGLVLTVVVFAFYLTRTENYNYGGNTAALRWLQWLSPFWWIAMIPACEALFCRHDGSASGDGPRWRRGVVGVLLGVSVFSAGWSLQTPWRPGWLMVLMETAGWVDYRTPPAPFDAPRRSVIGSVPATDGTWVRYMSQSGPHTTRLELRRTGERVEKSLRLVEITATLTEESIDDASGSRTEVIIYRLAEPLLGNARLQSEMVLMAPGAGADDDRKLTNEQRARWYNLLRGLPSDRTYQPGGPQWLKTSLRSDAFACERAASRVRFRHPQFGICWQRCDVLYCDDIPFGTLRWTTSVTDGQTGKTISTETWQVEAFSALTGGKS